MTDRYQRFLESEKRREKKIRIRQKSTGEVDREKRTYYNLDRLSGN